MNIILLGAPGSGKGTLGAKLEKHYGIPHISSGDIVRAEIKAKTPLGLSVKELIANGFLLDDTSQQMRQLLKMVQDRLQQPDCQHGFILDGIPRTLWQVSEVDRWLSLTHKKIHAAILLDVDNQSIIARLAGRMVCKICALSYHQDTNPPQVVNTCDRCHQALIRRPDDNESAVAKRLDLYQYAVGSIIDDYSTRNLLVRIDGTGTPNQVFEDVNRHLYPRNYLQQTIPSYPTPQGFPFYNIVEIYKNPCLMRYVVGQLVTRASNCDYLVSPEARALPLFGAVSHKLGKPGIFLRKAGKLPVDAPKLTASYNTAYSTDTLEMNYDSNLAGKKVVILDDGISSGGTILAAIELMQKAGAEVIDVMALIRYHYREVVSEYQIWESKTFTLFDL